MLFVDIFHHTRLPDAGASAFAPLAGDDRYVGIMLKASEGWRTTEHWSIDSTQWFLARWPQVLTAAGDRYADTFFRGAYHYLVFDPKRVQDQVDFYLANVAAAGGWGVGDLVPIVDVERGKASSANASASSALVEDVTSGFIAAVTAATGQPVMLYGRGAMRDLHITSRMGATYLWNPSYTASMHSAADQGWPTSDLWQYTDGKTNHTPYLTHAPGLGAVDASISLAPDLDTLRATIIRRKA
jgi:Glycosyl hydrolases family 25